MNEIKREVGQVWRNKIAALELEILKGYIDSDGQHRFAVLYTWDDGTIRGGHQSEEHIYKNYTLITNADGTPYQEPKQYREIDVWEAMRLLGEAREPIDVQMRDSGEWNNRKLIGALVNTEFPFVNECRGGWRQCRIEVKS